MRGEAVIRQCFPIREMHDWKINRSISFALGIQMMLLAQIKMQRIDELLGILRFFNQD